VTRPDASGRDRTIRPLSRPANGGAGRSAAAALEPRSAFGVPAREAQPDDPGPDDAPERRTVEPRTRLARAIAATIGGWLARGERLAARDRPIRPGDIMVLVRRRNEFVLDLLRALKQRGVPVAGADRMRIAEQLAEVPMYHEGVSREAAL